MQAATTLGDFAPDKRITGAERRGEGSGVRPGWRSFASSSTISAGRFRSIAAPEKERRSRWRSLPSLSNYDVALLDIDMPVKGGADRAAETRRGTDPHRVTRFLGMSAVEVPEGIGPAPSTRVSPSRSDHAVLRRVLLGGGHGLRPSQPGP
jgi:hypothetical protein